MTMCTTRCSSTYPLYIETWRLLTAVSGYRSVLKIGMDTRVLVFCLVPFVLPVEMATMLFVSRCKSGVHTMGNYGVGQCEASGSCVHQVYNLREREGEH